MLPKMVSVRLDRTVDLHDGIIGNI
jgi:hypothetical protein